MTRDKSVKLTRKQVEQLSQLHLVFQDVQSFEIVEDNSNGIGTSTTVRFTILKVNEQPDTTVDITDVSNW